MVLNFKTEWTRSMPLCATSFYWSSLTWTSTTTHRNFRDAKMRTRNPLLTADLVKNYLFRSGGSGAKKDRPQASQYGTARNSTKKRVTGAAIFDKVG